MTKKLKFDVVATTGMYERKGEKKYIRERVGVVLEDDNGHLTLKIDKIVFKEDGTIQTWMTLFEREQDGLELHTENPEKEE